jgi:hypothetical protein
LGRKTPGIEGAWLLPAHPRSQLRYIIPGGHNACKPPASGTRCCHPSISLRPLQARKPLGHLQRSRATRGVESVISEIGVHRIEAEME